MRLDVHPDYQFVSLPKEPHSDRGLLMFLPVYLHCPPQYTLTPTQYKSKCSCSNSALGKEKLFYLTQFFSCCLLIHMFQAIPGDKGPLNGYKGNVRLIERMQHDGKGVQIWLQVQTPNLCGRVMMIMHQPQFPRVQNGTHLKSQWAGEIKYVF